MDTFKAMEVERIELLERDKVALFADAQDARRVANDLCAEVELLKKEVVALEAGIRSLRRENKRIKQYIEYERL